MQVEYAFLADMAQAAPDGKLYVLGGGIDSITAAAFPHTHPQLALIVKLKVHFTECDRAHELEIQLWDPDGQRLGPGVKAQFTSQRRPDNPTGASYVQLVLNLLQQQFPRPGDYAFHVVVDGQHLKEVSLCLETSSSAAGG